MIYTIARICNYRKWKCLIIPICESSVGECVSPAFIHFFVFILHDIVPDVLGIAIMVVWYIYMVSDEQC